MQVQQASLFLLNVQDEMKLFTVYMEEKTCTCKKFEMDEISCSHAMAAINKRQMNPYKYCSTYYKMDTY